MEILQELDDKVRLGSISICILEAIPRRYPLHQAWVEEFRSSPPLTVIYLLLYWEAFHFLDGPVSRVEAAALTCDDVWGWCGGGEALTGFWDL